MRARRLAIRLVLLLVLAVGLTGLSAGPSGAGATPASCCSACLNRFNQCDGTTIVCCRIYNSCIQQCAGGCPNCPDEE
jgi:hypothetical protein